MSALNSAKISPQVFECDVDRSQIPWPYIYWHDTPGALIAGKDMLRAAGDLQGSPDPVGWTPATGYILRAGWTPGGGIFEKPARDGVHTLRVISCGMFWLIERSTKLVIRRHKIRQMDALVFAFGRIPIWTRARGAAMRLAEHCDPVPCPPVAGYWAPAYGCT
jgi:hypothetical protein